ncbi:unnamed protein product [Brassicogethes aeneus]|uniref:Uncharacterized protein n=1 Tax=Brassicogethes aeneus TaxID=1431903 RepID=A0A9P0BFB0_BRAAE|nr:unnamed protein product [Brassicogethes aeneus]
MLPKKNTGYDFNEIAMKAVSMQLSKLEAMGDAIAEKMSNINSSNNYTCKKSSPVVEDVSIDPIEIVEHLDAFENKLKDKDLMSFTHKNCEDFFKNVIRNSTRRSKSDLLRTSAIKKRSKKHAQNESKENETKETDKNNIAEEAFLDEDNEMEEQNNSI